MFVHEVLGPAPLANQVERFSSTLSQCMVQENASRPLVALEDAVDEQRSVIADIARLGLPIGDTHAYSRYCLTATVKYLL